MKRLRDFYRNLGERDQKALKLIAVFLPVLIYLAVVQPAYDFYQANRQAYTSNRELLQWMQQNKSSVEPGTSAAGGSRENIDLIQLVSTTAEKQAITFDRIQPVGDDKVRLFSEKAGFEKLVRWLGELQERGLTLDNIRLEKSSDPGQVSFHGTIGKPGR